MKKKTESLAEYLARGGKINVVPANKDARKEVAVKSTVSNPVTIMSYEEADQYYGTKTTRKRKAKKVDTSKLNMKCVPDDLKKILGITNEESEKS